MLLIAHNGVGVPQLSFHMDAGQDVKKEFIKTFKKKREKIHVFLEVGNKTLYTI